MDKAILGEKVINKTFLKPNKIALCYSTNYLLRGLRPVAIAGKAFGLLPLDVFSFIQKEEKKKYKRRCNFSTIYSIILCINALLYFANQTWIISSGFPKLNLVKKMESIQGPFYGLTVLFIFCYFFTHTPRLIEIIQKWNEVNASVTALFQPDINFPRFCILMTVLLLASSATENILFDMQEFSAKGKYAVNTTLLEMYYWRSGNIITLIIPYSSPIALVVTALSKISTYVWNVSDIILISLCRGLTNRFKVFEAYISLKLSSTQKDHIGSNPIERIRTDFEVLVELAEIISKFVSPLVVSCYCYNIYLMTLNIFRWLDPRGLGDEERKAYVYISFLQFSLRVILVTYHASTVHHSTEAIEKILERVPDSLYSPTVERLEKQLSRNPVGISLFGTFRVTRNFFISIISFLFTTEIVLLQTVTAPSDALKPCQHNKEIVN